MPGREAAVADEPRPSFVVRWTRRAATVFVVLVVAAGIVYLVRVPLLVWTGGLLLHVDPVMRADAIAVMGGGTLARELSAADLYAEGYAPVVVLTVAPERPILGELERRGLEATSTADARVQFLLETGVPLESITVLSRTVSSTHDEVALLAEWTASRSLERLIVVTSSYHSARTRLVFDELFVDHATEVIVHPAPVTDFNPKTWWQERRVLREVIFELEKLAYYRLMYALGMTA